MTSSYYPVTTDAYFANRQSQSIAPVSRCSPYRRMKPSDVNYSESDDDDLDELRRAALKTLNSKKRKNNQDRSPPSRNSRSSSRSYSSDSYSSSSRSLSSISSSSLDKHDKDYRFRSEEKQTTGDIDERFPQDAPINADMLILDCPIQDDEFLLCEEKQDSSRKPVDRDERKPSKEVVRRRRKSPSVERPVSITVKLNPDQFDLRQLIKKRRTAEPSSSSTTHRVVQVLPTDNNNLIVHKKVRDRPSSKVSDESRSSGKKH